MEIIKTLVLKTQRNKYTFDLTKNTYHFFYGNARSKTDNLFLVFKEGIKNLIISEETDYIMFYINNKFLRLMISLLN